MQYLQTIVKEITIVILPQLVFVVCTYGSLFPYESCSFSLRLQE